MNRRARRNRRCHTILVLSALVLRCYAFAACLPGGEALGGHGHTAAEGQAHRHADDAHEHHRHEEPAAPASGTDHEPVHCCNSSGVCMFTVASQTPLGERVLQIVSSTSSADVRHTTASNVEQRLARAVAHGPPTYLRLATLLI